MAPVHPPATDYAGYAYASLLIFGGLMGAIRRGSVISLAAGGLSGLWAAYGALRVSRDRHDVYVSLVMGFKFARNFKFMPAGLVMLVSVIMGTYYSLSIADQGDFSHMEFKDRL